MVAAVGAFSGMLVSPCRFVGGVQQRRSWQGVCPKWSWIVGASIEGVVRRRALRWIWRRVEAKIEWSSRSLFR